MFAWIGGRKNKMTVDEKYDTRVNLCRKLRNIEDEIEKIAELRDKYKQSTGNKKVTLSVYVEGNTVQYELDEKTANSCIEFIENDYSGRKYDIIQTLKQELKDY